MPKNLEKSTVATGLEKVNFHSFLGTKFSNLAYILPFFSILIWILNFYLKYLIGI